MEKLGSDGAGFDAVFSDVVMPGMGGIELAKILQRRMPDLPVLLASGYSHVLAQDGLHGFELLHKPYSADQLGRILGKVAPSRSAAAPHRNPARMAPHGHIGPGDGRERTCTDEAARLRALSRYRMLDTRANGTSTTSPRPPPTSARRPSRS